MKFLVILSAIVIASVVADETRNAHRQAMREKYENMTDEERREAHQGVRKHMMEKFEKLSKERQDAIKEKLINKFPAAAEAYKNTDGDVDKKIEAFYKSIPAEEKQRAKEHFKSMTPEQRQAFREKAREFFNKRDGRMASINETHKTREHIRRGDRLRDNVRDMHRIRNEKI